MTWPWLLTVAAGSGDDADAGSWPRAPQRRLGDPDHHAVLLHKVHTLCPTCQRLVVSHLASPPHPSPPAVTCAGRRRHFRDPPLPTAMAAATAPSAAALLADVGAPAHLARERCLLRLRAALPSPGVRAACRESLMAALAADASLTTPATATAGLEGGAAGDGGEPGDGGGGNSPAGGEVVVGGGSGSWERACGLLRAATEVLASAERGAGGGGAPAEDVPFEAAVMDAAVEGIRHEEVRVRQVRASGGRARVGWRGWEGAGEEWAGDGFALQMWPGAPDSLLRPFFDFALRLLLRTGVPPSTPS